MSVIETATVPLAQQQADALTVTYTLVPDAVLQGSPAIQ